MGSAAGGLPELRVRILPGTLMSVFFNVVCCQVEVSATGRSITQKSPTVCVRVCVCVCVFVCVCVTKCDQAQK